MFAHFCLAHVFFDRVVGVMHLQPTTEFPGVQHMFRMLPIISPWWCALPWDCCLRSLRHDCHQLNAPKPFADKLHTHRNRLWNDHSAVNIRDAHESVVLAQRLNKWTCQIIQLNDILTMGCVVYAFLHLFPPNVRVACLFDIVTCVLKRFDPQHGRSQRLT